MVVNGDGGMSSTSWTVRDSVKDVVEELRPWKYEEEKKKSSLVVISDILFPVQNRAINLDQIFTYSIKRERSNN